VTRRVTKLVRCEPDKTTVSTMIAAVPLLTAP
jgi:hypothetical protein